MKTKQTKKQIAVIFTILLLIMGCNKKEELTPDNGNNDDDLENINGITADDLEHYGGDLGILINVRDIEKKGYNPDKVNISTTATQGEYDRLINIDPFTNLAQLSFPVDSLSAEQVDELKNGIGLSLDILNQSNAVITSLSYSLVSFEENGKQLDIDASALNYANVSINFKENMRHYLQAVNEDGSYGSKVVWKPSSALDNNVVLHDRTSTWNKGTTSEQFFFYKFPNQTNTFAIYSANTYRYLATDENDKTLRQSGAVSYPVGLVDNSLNPVYRFIIKKESNGLYTINDMDGNPMRPYYNNGATSWRTNTGGNKQYFRIIALDVDWEVQDLGTKHLKPIFPAVNTSFGFNSTLTNCGTGDLEQQVGIEREVQTTYTSSMSETIGLSGRVTTSVEASVSATAEASFFGNGGSVTGEVSTGLEVSVEASQSTTIASEQSVSETNTFFSTRTVTVPSGKASLVYDAYQTYSNVRVPYVKRFRLRGQHTDTFEYLTGEEIETQLGVTGFTGTTTFVGPDYVEITINGNMYLDNIVDTQTEVRDVAANCD